MEAMNKLTRKDLYSLETYAQERPEFRKRVLAHKKNRYVPIGSNATLYFEDALTVQYQIQEMLRVERIFEVEGIEDELGAYNPLIPDGSNWKATFMVEFPEVGERRVQFARLIGIEDKVWVQVSGHDRVFAIADEDLERENDEKTSSVHFVRFELTPAMVAAVKSGAAVSIGIDHENYPYAVEPVSPNVRDALAADLA
jgi:hypothetical protein